MTADDLYAQALAHQRAGRLNDAQHLCQRILEREPRHARALHMLGICAHQAGSLDLAARLIGDAIVADPGVALFHGHIGVVHKALGRLDEAIASYRAALTLEWNCAEIHYNLGNALKAKACPQDAVECFRTAAELAPDFVLAHNNLGNALRELGSFEESARACIRAIELKPDYAEAHNNLGNAHQELGHLHEAVQNYLTAISLRPDYVQAYNNLGNAYHRLGRSADAIQNYRTALRHNDQHPEVHANLATALLTQGVMEEGWREYAWRWKSASMIDSQRHFMQPQWNGEAARGKTLLVHAEQGFGDTLHFCRYVSRASARGMRVIFEVQAPLLRLCQSLVGVDRVLARGQELPHFDYHCPLLSMPLALGETFSAETTRTPYLYADPQQVMLWRGTITSPKARVGLAWAGNPRLGRMTGTFTDRRRSIDPALLAPLMDVADVTFCSLQKSGPPMPVRFPLINAMDAMEDFADTAALVATLDLVICVDSAIAHLAGALGKPVWMLDRVDHCWRWRAGRSDSPWYPEMRIYRQSDWADWGPVVARVTEDLGIFAASTASLGQ